MDEYEAVLTEDFTHITRFRGRQWTLNDFSFRWAGGIVRPVLKPAFLIAGVVAVLCMPVLALLGSAVWLWLALPIGVIALVVSYLILAKDPGNALTAEQRTRLSWNYRRRQPKVLNGLTESDEPASQEWALIMFRLDERKGS